MKAAVPPDEDNVASMSINFHTVLSVMFIYSYDTETDTDN